MLRFGFVNLQTGKSSRPLCWGLSGTQVGQTSYVYFSGSNSTGRKRIKNHVEDANRLSNLFCRDLNLGSVLFVVSFVISNINCRGGLVGENAIFASCFMIVL